MAGRKAPRAPAPGTSALARLAELAGKGTPPGDLAHGYFIDGAHGITVSVTDSAGKTTLHGLTVLVAKAPTATLARTIAGGTATFTTTSAADPGQSGGHFVGQSPNRILDTRNSVPLGPGGTVDITVDATATAAVLNVTAVDATSGEVVSVNQDD